ncbi:MAG: hypothetical protein RIQ93_1396 [Verrucomicrobiota bacterium]|jgi:hypothetical protein
MFRRTGLPACGRTGAYPVSGGAQCLAHFLVRPRKRLAAGYNYVPQNVW